MMIPSADLGTRPSSVRALSQSVENPSKPLSPQEYSEAVLAHSKQGIQSSLYPGHNFEKLALYLRRPYDSQQNWQTNTTAVTKDSPFYFVSLYTLPPSGGQDYDQIADPEGLQSLQARSKNGEKASSQILFMRGQPSPEWLSTIGAVYLVDPEFFQRHLDFRSSTGRLDYFCLPSLPSTSNNIISLRFITIGQRDRRAQITDRKAVDELRQTGAKAMARYLHTLNSNMEMNSGLGNSIVRAFSIHDETHFAIEQRISICVRRSMSGWTAIIWLDSGNDLTKGPEGPWITSADRHNNLRTIFYPTIQTQPQVALKSHRMSVGEDVRPAGKYGQSSSLLHLEYGKSLDQQLMACDPFYAMHGLFTFCAFSEAQFLNMLESKLSADTGYNLLSKKTWGQTEQATLLYTQDILEAHARDLRDNIETIKSRGGPAWPRPSDPSSYRKGEAAARALQKDFEHLLSRSEALAAHCTAGLKILMNKMMIAESKEAIMQAQGVAKLTRLAFVYIPLTFTAGVFGMNLEPIVDARNSIWVFFAVSVPVLMVSIAPLLWDFPQLWEKIVKTKH